METHATGNAGGTRDAALLMTKLAELLVERGHLSADGLEELQHRAEWLGEGFDRVVVKEGDVPEDAVVDLVSEISGIPIVRIADAKVDTRAVDAVSAKVVSRYHMFPFEMNGETITIASDRVHDAMAEDEVRMLLERPVEWRLCTAHEVDECITHYYGVGIASYLGLESAAAEEPGRKSAEAADVPAFVTEILRDAVGAGATDVHFEPGPAGWRLRYRIDGVLCTIPLPKGAENYQKAVISSIKVMAQLNIAERRLPQDGRFSITADGRELDLRVSVLPSRYGEAVNLRILNRSAAFLKIEELGLNDEQLMALGTLATLPNGVVLFTGPTGSGKTTSLYATLAQLNTEERKIITIEDPVEYEIGGTVQMQVHPDIGFTFASGLRSSLRHDPDVIFIGEIRDVETANIAIRSALTGHIVFSTLHTNDSGSALVRLADMGIEPYLVASSVQGSIAQRLVRKVCEACKEPATIDEWAANEIRKAHGVRVDNARFRHGVGCPDCRFTGYSGRKAIYETLIMNDELRALVANRSSSTVIMNCAVEQGLVTLRESGWQCVCDGITTVEEIMRVT